MKSQDQDKRADCAAAFYGSSTVGERGQIVIPAEARTELGFHPGDKVLIMRHPLHKSLMICKIDGVREFLDEFATNLANLKELKDENEQEEA